MSIPVLSLPATPLADRFTRDQPRYPLSLRLDSATWLLYLDTLGGPSDTELFGSDYGFETSSSPSLVRYFAEYATWVHKNLLPYLARGMVEIGCNDGTLLRHFDPDLSFGIDPSRAAKVALGNGLNVVNEPFTSDLAYRSDFGSDQLVIANNVLAHVADLHDTLQGIAHLVGTEGAAVFEFGYAGDLIANADYPLVYHEHRRFFSLTSLAAVLQPHQLVPVSVLHTSQQGGSLRVVVKHVNRAMPDQSAIQCHLREQWLRRRDTYTTFQGRVDFLRNRLTERVLDEHEAGRRIALLGASAKATTLIHANGLDAVIDFAEDLTPYKQGKVMPGTEIPILPPKAVINQERRADTWLLGVPNYLGSIVGRHPNRRFILTPTGEVIN